jgi:hypothetical protein
VFTTHTPVPAGIDRFPRELFERYFTSFADECGVTFDELIAIGQPPDEPDKFNMAVMGMRLAARANGVARLHGEVSREMFGGIWPGCRPRRPDRPRDQRRPRPVLGERPGRRTAVGTTIGDEWHLADERSGSRCTATSTTARSGTCATTGRRELVDMVRPASATTCSIRTC